MYLLNEIHFTLPFTNPVMIFSLVLFIILFAPLLLNKIKVPHIIGLIIAGVIIGPYGFNLLLRDSSIVLFGTVGLLYIMFTAGLEIDMQQFRKNRFKSFAFGLYSFTIPMIFGTFSGYYLLDFSIASSILLGSMFASHTLVAYPITGKYGISRIRPVTLAIGGTIVTDILALLVLAAVTGMTRGDISSGFWLRLGISTLLFGLIVFLVFPIIARWFFKNFDEAISQYIFVLAMVFLGSFLAELAGLEAIIGAFLSGLALNKFIPNSSALMNRIEFVGNAFFIPFFLIGIGMLVDFRVQFNGFGALKVASVMTAFAILSKFLAAWAMQKTFRLNKNERQMIFALSTARVGATLAVVLIGYNIVIGENAAGDPIRLLNEDVLNGTILMILVTCTLSSFLVERVSQKIALADNHADHEEEQEKILVSLAYPESVIDLVDFAIMLKPKKKKVPIYALNIVSDESGTTKTKIVANKMMDKAVFHGTASDQVIIPITRFDINVGNGIIYTLKEQNITDVLIGLHHDANQNNFLGETTEKILKHTSETVYIYKPAQPVNTLKRIVVVVTPLAELEPGFAHWFTKLATIAAETGLGIEFYASKSTITEMNDLRQTQSTQGKMIFQEFINWEDFLIFSRKVETDDLFVIVSSRKGHRSYQHYLEKLPHYLSSYFTNNSFIMLYPEQTELGIKMDDIQHIDSSLLESISGSVESIGKKGGLINKLFKKK